MEVFKQKRVKPDKKPHGRQPNYSLQYMTMVAEKVVKGDLSYREAGKLFGASHGAIGAWVKNYKNKSWGVNTRAANKPLSDEVQVYRFESHVKDLKHEIAELYLENLMLKKIIQHSQQIKKENSSVITSENVDQLKKGAKS